MREAKEVTVSIQAAEDLSYLTARFMSGDGSPLTAQDLIDVFSDYLLIDPEGVFQDEPMESSRLS